MKEVIYLKNERTVHYDDEFFCTKCGASQQFFIPRPHNKDRDSGHLKKMWCFKCNDEVNFVECKPNSTKYNHQDFLLEFYGKNFNENGYRNEDYNIFKHSIISVLNKIGMTQEDFIDIAEGKE